MTTNNVEWSVEDAERIYGVSSWGGGYFKIGENGNIQVSPDPKNANIKIDFKSVIDEITLEGIQFPVVIRFHDILRSQVVGINECFNQVIADAKYQGRYNGVYPIKVNQTREVVEEIVDAGAPYDYGLEAGSKAELLAVLAYNTNANSLTILNGYKDEEFIRLSLLGRKLGRKVVVVIEKFSELHLLIRISKELNIEGKWQGSSGDRAKFGLTIPEIINAAKFLEKEGMGHTLKLLHFHIGSQLTDIRAIKDAVNESARIYTELHKMGFALEYVDVGGGLGIDYDGSKSTNDSSRNYSLNEYVADVVYGMKEVCDLEGVPHPNLVTESGRAITAHHSCVVTEIVGEIKADGAVLDTAMTEGEHVILKNMREVLHFLTAEQNLQEVYNDACEWKEQAVSAFKLRVVSLEELGKIETLYWQIMRRLQVLYRDVEFVPEGLQHLDFSLSSQYLCNFSIFQSAADTWAIDQLLPVVPLTGMDKRPDINCSLVDITCDSDGKIDQFIVDRQLQNIMPIASLAPGQKAYLGLFLTGAYQDVMGDMHNLFGRVNDEPEDFYIEEFVAGSSVQDVLTIMQYNPSAMAVDVKRQIDKEVANGQIPPREGVKWTDFYENCLKGYTYLKTS
jgi:arginine decarboxylase